MCYLSIIRYKLKNALSANFYSESWNNKNGKEKTLYNIDGNCYIIACGKINIKELKERHNYGS